MNPNELYRLFFEETSEALMAVRIPEGRLVFVNPAFGALTGYAREEVENETINILNAVIDHGSSRDRSMDLAMLSTPGFYNDVALSTREGVTRFVTVKVRHAQLGTDRVALAVISDDTERQLLVRDLTIKHQSLESAYLDLERMHTELKLTQDKMLQASKLVALGELAAGMSHELNQPLTGIRGFAQEVGDILKHQPKPSKREIAKLCGLIVTNADKMASLLSHLREFARKGRNPDSTTVEAVSLADSVKNVELLLKRQLEKQNVAFETRGFDDNLFALAESHPVEQILINLVTNSRDAIRTRGPNFKGKITLTLAREDGDVYLRVSDNGPGIPESIRGRVFDPFFSTKDTGKGMGLGLSISFGLAHKFQGELRLEHTSERGTTFCLRLPQAKTPAPRQAA